MKIDRAHPGQYRIDRRWLMLERDPRMAEQHQRLIAERGVAGELGPRLA